MKTRILWLLLLVSAAAYSDPKTDYLLYCRGCHLADGSGVPPEVPTLINDVGKLLALPGGREYIARVPGVVQTDMNDAQLAAVLNWVVTEFNSQTTPTSFAPYTAEFITSVRDNVLINPLKHRADLVSQ
jgi:hypothetical protein